MNINHSLILVVPGFFQIKQGHAAKGAVIAAVSGLSFFLYAVSLYRDSEGSYFVFVFLATVLFSLLDAAENSVEQKKEEPLRSFNPYEDARIAMLTLNYVRAEELFHQAFEKKPGDMDVVFQLAVLNKKMGRFNKSKSWLKKYLKQKKHTEWTTEAQKLLEELKGDSSDTQGI